MGSKKLGRLNSLSFRLITLVFVLFLVLSAGVFADTITKFSDESTEKNLTYAGADNQSAWVNISQYATILNASLNVTGYLTYNHSTAWAMDNQSTGGNLFDNNEGTYIWANADFLSRTDNGNFSNFTIHENAINFSHKIRVFGFDDGQPGLKCFFKMYIYNHTSSTWVLLNSSDYVDVGSFDDYLIVTNYTLTPDMKDSANRIWINYSVEYIWSGWPGTQVCRFGENYQKSSYEVGAYPNDPYIDIGNDSDSEWNYSGSYESTTTLDNSNTNPDFTQELQDYVDSCGSNPCKVPLRFYSASSGILNLWGLNIEYTIGPSINSNETYPANPKFWDTFWAIANVTAGSPVEWVNFTITNPNFVVVLDNQNGTNWNSDMWNSSSALINQPGNWTVFIEAKASGSPVISNSTMEFTVIEDVGNIYMYNSSNRSLQMNDTQTKQIDFNITNNGNYTLSECFATLGGDFKSKAWVSWNLGNSFTVNVGQNRTLSAISTKPTQGNYTSDKMQINCSATPSGIRDLLEEDNRPYVTLNVTHYEGIVEEDNGGGGGGGGGSSGPSNHPPVLDPIGDQEATAGTQFELIVTAMDIDNDTLIFRDDAPLFRIASIEQMKARIRFTPTAEQVGRHNVTVVVMDELMANDSETFVFTIKAPPTLSVETEEPVEEPSIVTGYVPVQESGFNPWLIIIVGAVLLSGSLAYSYKSGKLEDLKTGIIGRLSLGSRLRNFGSGIGRAFSGAGSRLSEVKLPKPSPKTRAQTQVQKPSMEITTEMNAIIGALHEREGEIIQSMVEQGGSSTQARIYHQTGMPTTTLARWVDSLERRGLIETQKFGKLRKIKLTEKFINGGNSI